MTKYVSQGSVASMVATSDTLEVSWDF